MVVADTRQNMSSAWIEPRHDDNMRLEMISGKKEIYVVREKKHARRPCEHGYDMMTMRRRMRSDDRLLGRQCGV